MLIDVTCERAYNLKPLDESLEIIEFSFPQRMKKKEDETKHLLRSVVANVSLMSLSLLKKLDRSEVKTTRMTTQLVDKSIKYSFDIIDNVPIKVDKFTFHICKTILSNYILINVQQEKLKLKDHNEEVIFSFFKDSSHATNTNE
ncbi:hypothetical protein CR513_46889, partial [Mucuna pruriens]